MGMRMINGAAALSEFQGFTGDCGETAELASLHVVDPVKWPLNAATLGAIVKRDIGTGWTSANGAEPLSTIAADLALAGVAFINHGYGEPLGYSWRAILDAQGGMRPLVLEVAVAGNLPGDEANVRYHFITCLGWDPAAGAGFFADGDDAAARGGSLNRYSAAQIEAATVCGVLEITTPVKGWRQVGVPEGWTDDGSTLRAPNGNVVVKGFRWWVLTHAWNPQDEPQGPESYANPVEYSDPAKGDGSIQAFNLTGQLCWTQARGVYVATPGAELFALRSALDAANKGETKNALTPAEIAALEAIRDMAAALVAVKSAS
jgi:hypothetical protein